MGFADMAMDSLAQQSFEEEGAESTDWDSLGGCCCPDTAMLDGRCCCCCCRNDGCNLGVVDPSCLGVEPLDSHSEGTAGADTGGRECIGRAGRSDQKRINDCPPWNATTSTERWMMTGELWVG